MHATAHPRKSTGTPVTFKLSAGTERAANARQSQTINFANGGAARLSPVQRLCAQYEATLTAFTEAHGKYSKAEEAFHQKRPTAPASIRATKRNLADLDYSIRGPRRPITANEIRGSIKSLRENTIREEKSAGARVVTISDAGFPLTDKQKARLHRLEAKLPLAVAYEAKCDAVHQRLKVDELCDAAHIPSSKLGPLAGKIADLPSQDRADMLAKAKIIQIDPDMAEVSEDIGLSLAQDFIRLASAGLI